MGSSSTRQRRKKKEWLTGISPLVAECMDFIDEGLNGLTFSCIISFSDPDHVTVFAGLTCLTQLAFGATAEFNHNPVVVEWPPRERGMCGSSDDTGQPEAEVRELCFLFLTEFGKPSGGKGNDREPVALPW